MEQLIYDVFLEYLQHSTVNEQIFSLNWRQEEEEMIQPWRSSRSGLLLSRFLDSSKKSNIKSNNISFRGMDIGKWLRSGPLYGFWSKLWFCHVITKTTKNTYAYDTCTTCQDV
uniref:Uncharacterized protein n=1 Tax=Picea glauca TaxID=3330 RepID=A0A124GMC8_PICGL|nr:hypothetical protein ABT39_MTgene3517 [Picea glauca]